MGPTVVMGVFRWVDYVDGEHSKLSSNDFDLGQTPDQILEPG